VKRRRKSGGRDSPGRPPTRGVCVGVAARDDVVAGLPELAADARRGERPGRRRGGGHGHGHGLLGLHGHERAVARGVEQQRLHIGVGEQGRLDVERGGRAAAGEGGGAGHGLLLVVAGELDDLGAGGHRRRREATAGIDACQSTRSPPFFSGGSGQGARFADLGFRWELVACARGLPRVYFRPCSLVACVEFEMAMQLSEKMTLKSFLLGGK